MPISLELLENLRDGFRDSAYKDEDKLSELENRGRMLVRRAVGEDSNYYQRFVHIGFTLLFILLLSSMKESVGRMDGYRAFAQLHA